MSETTDGRFVHWNCPRCLRQFLHVGPADQGGVCPHCGKAFAPVEVKGTRAALRAVQDEIERAEWRAWQQATEEQRAAHEAGRAAYRAADPAQRGPLYARSPYTGKRRWKDLPQSVRELHTWWMRGWAQAEIDVANERAREDQDEERAADRATPRPSHKRSSESGSSSRNVGDGGETSFGARA